MYACRERRRSTTVVNSQEAEPYVQTSSPSDRLGIVSPLPRSRRTPHVRPPPTSRPAEPRRRRRRSSLSALHGRAKKRAALGDCGIESERSEEKAALSLRYTRQIRKQEEEKSSREGEGSEEDLVRKRELQSSRVRIPKGSDDELRGQSTGPPTDLDVVRVVSFAFFQVSSQLVLDIGRKKTADVVDDCTYSKDVETADGPRDALIEDEEDIVDDRRVVPVIVLVFFFFLNAHSPRD